MKTACLQMPVTDDKCENLRTAQAYICEAKRNGADIAVLPEMFCCPYENKSFIENAEPEGGFIFSELSRFAKENGILLVGGTMPEKCGDKLYNTCFVFDENGKLIAKHRKMHLFDIDVEGGQRFKESDTFSAGDSVTLFDCKFGRMGVMVCFDIRFVELSRIMALEGAEAIFVPAAFNMTTGPAHWELSFRQRAVDNQLFMLGCAPARDTSAAYVSYGNSIVTDPWGSVLARAGHAPEILYAEPDLSLNRKIRKELPILSARRTDVYSTEHKKQQI